MGDMAESKGGAGKQAGYLADFVGNQISCQCVVIVLYRPMSGHKLQGQEGEEREREQQIGLMEFR